jgi:CDP-glucose 4,6-dehydratase
MDFEFAEPRIKPLIHSDFWAGRRVFLTGHTGFKGAWMSLLLRLLGAEVHGFALPPDEQGIFALAGVRDDG